MNLMPNLPDGSPDAFGRWWFSDIFKVSNNKGHLVIDRLNQSSAYRAYCLSKPQPRWPRGTYSGPRFDEWAALVEHMARIVEARLSAQAALETI